jgi:hypothetical protein
VRETEEQKIKVLKSSNHFNQKQEGVWKNIFMHQDLTMKEIQERKVLVHELKENSGL